jgi:hypothetical protein
VVLLDLLDLLALLGHLILLLQEVQFISMPH